MEIAGAFTGSSASGCKRAPNASAGPGATKPRANRLNRSCRKARASSGESNTPSAHPHDARRWVQRSGPSARSGSKGPLGPKPSGHCTAGKSSGRASRQSSQLSTRGVVQSRGARTFRSDPRRSTVRAPVRARGAANAGICSNFIGSLQRRPSNSRPRRRGSQ